MGDRVHFCITGTGLDDLPVAKQRDKRVVAAHLAKHGRFSVFEATATPAIAKTMDALREIGWFDFDYEGSSYPWVGCALTEAGKRELGYE